MILARFKFIIWSREVLAERKAKTQEIAAIIVLANKRMFGVVAVDEKKFAKFYLVIERLFYLSLLACDNAEPARLFAVFEEDLSERTLEAIVEIFNEVILFYFYNFLNINLCFFRPTFSTFFTFIFCSTLFTVPYIRCCCR